MTGQATLRTGLSNFKSGHTVLQLGDEPGAVTGTGFCSVSFHSGCAGIQGVLAEDAFSSHAGKIAVIFRSAGAFDGLGELLFLTDEGDAFN